MNSIETHEVVDGEGGGGKTSDSLTATVVIQMKAEVCLWTAWCASHKFSALNDKMLKKVDII